MNMLYYVKKKTILVDKKSKFQTFEYLSRTVSETPQKKDRRLVNETINPVTQHIILLKIVGFLFSYYSAL